jgi:hypothetical protein
MTVIPFDPSRRPCVILDSGTVTKSDEFSIGSPVFWLEYRDGDLSETVWVGADYAAARIAARDWTRDGARLIDRTIN